MTMEAAEPQRCITVMDKHSGNLNLWITEPQPCPKAGQRLHRLCSQYSSGTKHNSVRLCSQCNISSSFADSVAKHKPLRHESAA
mmetsp:Transcript_19841/g.55338  ORF Transcript_19841/g.55338 Transcript_19841/m.55338 type:complete len:84 (-) Transcript_19841:1666-1917(-)